MSSPISCTPCCDTTNTVNTPGSAGNNAYTTTTSNFTIPAIASTVTINVGSTAWMAVGQKVFASDGTDVGTFEVQSIGGSTSFVGVFMGYADDSSPGAVVGSGAAVVPSGSASSTVNTTALKAANAILLSGINSFTDNTTGTASDTLAAGVGIYTVSAYINLVNITGTGNVFYFVPGHAFKVLSITATTEKPESVASKAITLTPYVNGVSVTGGALALTTANVTTVGGNISATAITAANTGTNAQSLNIQCTTFTAAFTNGAVRVILSVQNMDSANAFASLADKINDIKAALQT